MTCTSSTLFRTASHERAMCVRSEHGCLTLFFAGTSLQRWVDGRVFHSAGFTENPEAEVASYAGT